MKRRFVSYILIFTSLMLIILSGCALLDNCSFNSSEIYASGDVLYCYIDEVGGRSRIRGKNVAICDLTNKGYEKEIIILPDELDGKPVIQLGHCDFMYQSSIGSYTQKIYLPPTILEIARMYPELELADDNDHPIGDNDEQLLGRLVENFDLSILP